MKFAIHIWTWLDDGSTAEGWVKDCGCMDDCSCPPKLFPTKDDAQEYIDNWMIPEIRECCDVREYIP